MRVMQQRVSFSSSMSRVRWLWSHCDAAAKCEWRAKACWQQPDKSRRAEQGQYVIGLWGCGKWHARRPRLWIVDCAAERV